MNCLASLGVSLATGLIALVPTAFVADWCTRWSEVSEREGGRGYAVVFLALLGFFLGCVLGLIVARMVAASGQPSAWRALAISLATAFGLLALITGYTYAVTEHAPEIDGQSLSLAFELRLPDNPRKPDMEELRKLQISLYAANRQSYRYFWARDEDLVRLENRWILQGRIHLHSRGAGRILRLTAGESVPMQEIAIPYAGFPTRADEKWSEWIAVPAAKGELRYRLHVEVPEPYVYVSPEDEETKAFQALSELSPLEDWLRFVADPIKERQSAAMGMIAQRTPELAACIREGNPVAMRQALRAVGSLSQPPELLVEPVREIGRRLRADLEKFRAAKPDDYASYNLAGEIESTFTSWSLAVRTLHLAKRLEARQEYGPIHELARQRPDSQALASVVRVTAYYLNESPGESPEPTPTK